MVRPVQREERGAYWDEVYSTKCETAVSWYQEEPALSLELIRSVSEGPGTRVIDVGGGAAVLVDRLLHLGYRSPAVLDLSQAALDRAKARLGEAAGQVEWIVGDITRVEALGTFAIWHDRAVFHFLTSPEDREAYRSLAERTLPAGGHLILATFSPEGPERCSGLPVCRYDAISLAAEMGARFTLLRSVEEQHRTPWGTLQPFVYCLFRREGSRVEPGEPVG